LISFFIDFQARMAYLLKIIMSIPRNHHYVSQVLSRKFLDNTGKLYLYDKTKKEFKTVDSTQYLFSQRDLNSALKEDGTLDHSSVENTLNRHFETDFNKHYERILAAANMNVPIGHRFADSEKLTESLEYMIRIGVIGEMRTPYNMKENENALFGSLLMIAERATEELKSGIYSYYNSLSGVTNKTPVDLNEVCDKALNLMGNKVYTLHRAPEGSFFLLPDCSAIIGRAQLEDDIVIDGKTYHNPANLIASVTMPINSRMMIGTNAKKVMPGTNTGFHRLNGEGMQIMNKLFFDAAYKEVVCEDETYLRNFVAQQLKSPAITG
jgi:hypothetical protein